ncbi:hypothetical protein Clacol_005983 [Clathrus columnatus]|uniref:T6SS Phospholipase effector Tle1-like catalytic domain-containing protein n=1 Tax=Clathrus columnatus TaxID=1419009 RepID=A0AAV5ABM2_9AGAM|nr:hypothetical protein Clacol_005983 [Clathrus columnatus]
MTSAEHKNRNLIVCIDGTSNQFGKYSTNVVDLYNKIVKSDDQLTYYNSGIGTYMKPTKDPLVLAFRKPQNGVDLAIASRLERNITKAYRWLSDNYRDGDKIYLFGFSRGAYQVRVLAGIIQRVGLIYKGNDEQIPFAYKLYHTSDDGDAQRFKKTFSREEVHIHFIGFDRDTVSSVGVIRGKPLPLSTSADHVCYFRHALALDERRVKFLPEYVDKPKDDAKDTFCNMRPDIKEVWFPGTHSDIGGGNRMNTDADLLVGGMPLLWMSFEAFSCGLILEPPRTIQWPWDNGQKPMVTESLTLRWKLFEWIPWKRPSYSNPGSTTRSLINLNPFFRGLHRGHGRKMMLSTQKVHSSATFYPLSYRPKAVLNSEGNSIQDQSPPSWGDIFPTEEERGTEKWKEKWEQSWETVLEKDILDYSLSPDVFETIESGSSNDQRMWLYRLAIVMQTGEFPFTDIINVLLTESRNMTGPADGDSIVLDYSLTNLINDNTFDVLMDMENPKPLTEPANEVLNLFPTLLSSATLSYRDLGVIYQDVRMKLSYPLIPQVTQQILKSVLDNGEAYFIPKADQNWDRIFDNDVILDLFDSFGETRDIVQGIEYGYLPTEVVKEVVLNRVVNGPWDYNNPYAETRLYVLSIVKAIIPLLDVHDESHRGGIRDVLQTALKDPNPSVKQQAVELCTYALGYEGILNDDLFSSMRNLVSFDEDIATGAVVVDFYKTVTTSQSIMLDGSTIRAIWRRLYRVIKSSYREQTILQFFKAAAAARDDLVKEIFKTEYTTAILLRLIADPTFETKEGVISFFTAVILQDRLRDILLTSDIVSALCDCRWLNDNESIIRARAVNFFKAVATQESLRRNVNSRSVSALEKRLEDSESVLKIKGVDVEATLRQEDLQDRLFNHKTISALGNLLVDSDNDVIKRTIDFFKAILNRENLRDKVITDKNISLLGDRLGDSEDVRKEAIDFFEAALSTHEALRSKLFNIEKCVPALKDRLGDGEYSVKTRAIDFFKVALRQEDLRDMLFDMENISALGSLLDDDADSVREAAIDFFEAALNLESMLERLPMSRNMIPHLSSLGEHDSRAMRLFEATLTRSIYGGSLHINSDVFGNTLFTSNNVLTLQNLLVDSKSHIRAKAVDFYKMALKQESLRDRLFNQKVISALGKHLANDDDEIKKRAVDFFKTALTRSQGSLRDLIFDSQSTSALLNWLDSGDSGLKEKAIDFFVAALYQRDLRDSLLNDSDDSVRKGAMNFFKVALTQEGLRNLLFDPHNISSFPDELDNDNGSNLKAKEINLLALALTQRSLREEFFNPGNISSLENRLKDIDSHIKVKAINLFKAALAQSAYNTADLRNRLLDPERLSALVDLLGDDDDNVRTGAIDFFQGALVQGA